jgi:hypothetical protein
MLAQKPVAISQSFILFCAAKNFHADISRVTGLEKQAQELLEIYLSMPGWFVHGICDMNVFYGFNVFSDKSRVGSVIEMIRV